MITEVIKRECLKGPLVMYGWDSQSQKYQIGPVNLIWDNDLKCWVVPHREK